MTQTTLATIPKLIAQVLSIYDVEPSLVFLDAGVSLDNSDVNQRVAMEDMARLWQKTVEATKNTQIGLVAASLFQPTYLKGIGLAWMASANLEDGLRRFVNSSQMINTAMQIELIDKDDEVIIQYKTKSNVENSVKVHPCAIQLGIGFFLKMFRLAASKNIPATGVYFTFPITNEALAEFETYFQCPVYGNSSSNCISFSQQLLQELLPTHDPELVELNESAIAKYITNMGIEETTAKVIQIITRLLPSGCPSEEVIAFEMLTSKRTLQRRLKNEGQSYSDILQNVRITLAKQLLTTTELASTEIAYQLGYSSPSTFARSFKKLTGVSPLEFRKQT